MNTSSSSSPASESQLRAGVAALGHGFNEDILVATRALYRPSIIANLKTDGAVAADVPYGPAERHQLDVYQGRGSKLPVLVFVHGGGFVAGSKRSDAEFYGNIGHYFANAGFVSVIMNYRLAPAATWPSGASDIDLAMEWIHANIHDYGGDAEQVFLMGQSAGAAHAAAYLFDADFAARATARVKAAILLNGVFRFKAPLTGGTLAYYGADAATYPRRSPLGHVGNSRVPLMIGVSEFDPALFVSQGFALAEAVTLRDGKSPEFYWMGGHNHVSQVHSLGSAQDEVGQRLTGFLRRFVRT